MKTHATVSLAMCVITFTTLLTSQQLSAQSTASITFLNTGVQDDGTLVPDGGADPHYTLISSDDPRFPVPTDTFTLSQPDEYPFNVGLWVSNTPISKWIAPDSDNNANPAGGYYTYRTTFSLPASFNPFTDAAYIVGSWATDNDGTDILINGFSTGNIIPFVSGGLFSHQYFSTLAITRDFQAGLNTLDFVILQDGGSPSGIHVQLTGFVKLDGNFGGHIVNDKVNFVVQSTFFDPDSVPGGPAGTFTIVAVLTNKSTDIVRIPISAIVKTLTNGNTLLTATEGTGGVGSKQAIDAGHDAMLVPNESVTVRFRIGLANRNGFTFFVDVSGIVGGDD